MRLSYSLLFLNWSTCVWHSYSFKSYNFLKQASTKITLKPYFSIKFDINFPICEHAPYIITLFDLFWSKSEILKSCYLLHKILRKIYFIEGHESCKIELLENVLFRLHNPYPVQLPVIEDHKKPKIVCLNNFQTLWTPAIKMKYDKKLPTLISLFWPYFTVILH